MMRRTASGKAKRGLLCSASADSSSQSRGSADPVAGLEGAERRFRRCGIDRPITPSDQRTGQVNQPTTAMTNSGRISSCSSTRTTMLVGTKPWPHALRIRRSHLDRRPRAIRTDSHRYTAGLNARKMSWQS